MGVCLPDMNSCTPKCKVCTGPNAGKAYECSDPCGCYKANNIQLYSWDGYDCVKGSGCAPYGGTNCSGVISYCFGVELRTTNTGPAGTTTNINNFSYAPVEALIGTQNGCPWYNSTLSLGSSITSAADPLYPTGYGWLWNLPTRNPSWVYGGKSHQLNPFGGTAQIGVQFYLNYANGGTSYIDTFGFIPVGNPQCLVQCCGCTPCSEYWGCPGFTYQRAQPAPSDELYGKIQVDMTKMIVVTRWTSGPNASTSYWTRIG